MAKTNIEWADAVWNPVTGCTKVSEGCRNCYAETYAKRFWGERKFTFVQCHEDRLYQPLQWKKPRKIFVNSMSDLFHPDVPIEFIAEVFEIMASHPFLCRKKNCEHDDPDCFMYPNHTYLILTKRPDRMHDVLNNKLPRFVGNNYPGDSSLSLMLETNGYPLPNVWLGVSIENQETADERIPLLLHTPAAVRFVSIEPMLELVDLHGFQPFRLTDDRAWFCAGGIVSGKIDWIICGGESGPNARPMHPDWVRSIRDQCQEAGVPFFFKQWGEWAEVRTLTQEVVMQYSRDEHSYIDGNLMFKIGKKRAGRLLDGREWNEYPGGVECG